MRDDQAKRDKSAFEAFKRWRLAFSRSEDAAVFLRKLDQCVRNCHLGSQEVMNQLPTLFEGDTWYWFDANAPQFRNFEDFKRSIRKEFMNTNEDDVKDLFNRTQGSDEEVGSFLVKFKLLAKDIDLFSTYSESEIARMACKTCAQNISPIFEESTSTALPNLKRSAGKLPRATKAFKIFAHHQSPRVL